MSLAQFKAYLETEEAKKAVVKHAREAGFEVSEEDLAGVSGGLLDNNGSDKQSHTLKDGRDVKEGIILKDGRDVKEGIILKDGRDVKDGIILKGGR